MTKGQDKDTILINNALEGNNNPPQLNIGAVPACPTPLNIPISQQEPDSPKEDLKFSRWIPQWLIKSKWYVPYLLFAAFLVFSGVIGIILYFTVFQARQAGRSVKTLAGSGSASYADGLGTAASFSFPTGVALDANGIVYVADTWNHRIRMISLSGNVTTLAGNGFIGDADGMGTSASFHYPTGVAVDANGIVYVADNGNHRIRMISLSGSVTTLAGNGFIGDADGMGTAASFRYPFGVAVDSKGIVYVADNDSHRIRMISLLGNVTTLAGSGSVLYADGMGSAASFYLPTGVALDANGIVYVADCENNRIRIISLSGSVTTLAGNGSASYADGIGTAASFNNPRGVALDSNGIVYVADTYNHRIRLISKSGNVTTLAGNGSASYADGMGTDALFDGPSGVAVGSNGKVYVADTWNHRIRMIS
jgi:sugar lactone lactonase YvrE